MYLGAGQYAHPDLVRRLCNILKQQPLSVLVLLRARGTHSPASSPVIGAVPSKTARRWHVFGPRASSTIEG